MKVNFSFVYLNLRQIAGYELSVASTVHCAIWCHL